MSNISVEQWVELFEGIGMDQTKRHQWHRSFEQKHPDAHQSFLEWLGIEQSKIKEIRAQ